MLIVLSEKEYNDLKEKAESLQQHVYRVQSGKDEAERALRGAVEDIKRKDEIYNNLLDKDLPMFGLGRKVRDL